MGSEATQRRLAVILSADVVGYSRLMAEDEDVTVRTRRRPIVVATLIPSCNRIRDILEPDAALAAPDRRER